MVSVKVCSHKVTPDRTALLPDGPNRRWPPAAILIISKSHICARDHPFHLVFGSRQLLGEVCGPEKIMREEYIMHNLKRFIFGRWKASLIASTVVVLVLVVTPIRKMPKALSIRNGKLRNVAYIFVTSFPTDRPS